MWYNCRIILYRRIFWALAGSGIVLFIFAHGNAQAADVRVVGEVTFQGNRQVKLRTLKSTVKLRKGDVVNDALVQEDIKRLYDLGWFEDVTADTFDLPKESWVKGKASVRLTFSLKERPAVKRIDFKGNQKVSAGRLREKISSKESDPYDRSKASQDVQSTLEVYRDEGFVDARVEFYTSEDLQTDSVILTFFITEGQRVMVQGVDFSGNLSFSERKLRGVMKTRRKKVYKEEVLNQDLDSLSNFYKEKGFLDIKVSSPTLTLNEDKTKVSIAIRVNEGSRYVVGNFRFRGNKIFTEPELRKAVTLKTRKPFQQSKLDESSKKIQEMYADKGYLRTEVAPIPEEQPAKGLVDYTFSISESSIVYVDGIYVDGNTYTKDFVILREVLVKPGDVFAANKIRRSVEKIYNLGFLDDVQVDVQQPRSPDRADVVFTVKEGKPGILSAGAGYSSVDGLLGTLQVQHINLFGRAQRLNLTWEFGARVKNYEISWTDPWFLGKPMSGGVNLFNTNRVLPFGSNISGFTEARSGGSLSLGPRLSETLSLLFTYTYADVNISSLSQDAINGGLTETHDQTSSITSEVIKDTRDNVFDASRGSRNSAAVQVAGGALGGTVDFYKPTVSSAWYFPTIWKFVLSTSFRAGFVEPYGRARYVPIQDRFLVGGVDTVRGYSLGQVGPPNESVLMSVANVEYKFPIVQESGRTILQGAFFYDIGGGWSLARDIVLQPGSGQNQLKSGAGFGIRFKTPVFPIRLDWGYGFNHGAGEGVSQFYFTIGNIF
jgi:outer membrane protein insertion porin family